MKKFLLSWILVVTFIFFDLPLRACADAQTYYTYSYEFNGSYLITAGSTSQIRDTPSTTIFYLKDIPAFSQDYPDPNAIPFDILYLTFLNVGRLSVISSDGSSNWSSYFSNQSAGSFDFRVGGSVFKHGDFPWYNTNFNSSNVYLDFKHIRNYRDVNLYIIHHPVPTSNVSSVSTQWRVSYIIYFVFVTTTYIDTSDSQTKLVAINNSIAGVQSSLALLKSSLDSGFSTVNSDLLDILNVLNQIAASGGSGGTGTAAIVGAVNGATAAIGQVLAQQQTSSADIVGAVNSQTSSLNNAIQGQTNSLNSTLSLVDASVNKITSTLEQDKQDNINAATEKGNELTGMATQIKNTAETSWDALSFPIDFTNQVFQVFSGGTSSAAYTRAYGDVLGYRYNSDTGGLEPIYRRYRDGTPRVTGGTTITFPAFSLPVPGVGTLQLWDSYEFDLSVISGYLPALFDALHLIIGILLIYWVIGYLIDLGHDIIG